MRSNSECLYCTGQALEKLLEDPDFLKNYDYNPNEDDLSDEEDELSESAIINDFKSYQDSIINYSQYET
eukprot:CAMPEP_0170551192 /NCGR_PEP_ID=MMETSP0211-20121228/9217_1 /TAXON_ID=311385 /ORGANISM="Pseudokeronopsis sp., Strain OXSARD2" /LENGTH=68 /DNA_ID=CAMNT_0010858211 /DNA_START=738 /DNA_END=944 /DNA_ORIENTATION=-